MSFQLVPQISNSYWYFFFFSEEETAVVTEVMYAMVMYVWSIENHNKEEKLLQVPPPKAQACTRDTAGSGPDHLN